MEVLKDFAPSRNPIFWVFVNAAVLCYSIVLLGLMLASDDDASYVVLAQTGYIIYDFLTTLIWLIQIGLNLYDYGPWSEWTAMHYLELILGVVFITDSAHVLYEWKFKEEDIAADFILTTLNAVGYLYELVSVIMTFVEESRKGGEEIPSRVNYESIE